MPALNFMARFAPLVESGEKRQTIRKVRKNPIKPGDTLYLYTGMRTKECRKLGEAVCTSVGPIEIGGRCCGPPSLGFDGMLVGWARGVESDDLDAFARADGLADFAEMVDFFDKHYSLPFEGVLIRWELREGPDQ